MSQKDYVQKFDSLDNLAHQLRCFAMDTASKLDPNELSQGNVASWDSSPNPIEYWSSEEGCEAIDYVMHMERAKKVILDYYKKEKDDGDYEVAKKDFEVIVKSMASEVWTITSIRLAAEGELEMAWDDELQDFVFKKGEKKDDDNSEA